MSHKGPINLKVVSGEHYVYAMRVLVVLGIASACVNTQLLFAAVLLIIFLKMEWVAGTLGFFKVSDSKLTLIIFPDGKLRLESNENIIEGNLGSQQWCTNHVAIIQLIDGVETRSLVILSAQQKNQEDFRRFNMWIRQDFCHDAKGVLVSGK